MVRAFLATLAAALVGSVAAVTTADASASPLLPERPPHERLWQERMPDGRYATVYADGTALLRGVGVHPTVEFRLLPEALSTGALADPALLDHAHVTAELRTPRHRPFAPDRVVVVFRNVAPAQDVVRVPLSTLAALRASPAADAQPPAYTSDRATNAVLALLGVDEAERVARAFPRSRLAGLVASAQAQTSAPLLDVSAAFRLHLTGARVEAAVAALRRLPTVAYAAPDWTVRPMIARATPVRGTVTPSERAAPDAPRLPLNYALRSSLAAFLNAPGDDAVAAYDEIEARFGELPGTGETITNVSIGDVDDDSKDSPCFLSALFNGPTVRSIGGQHYLDLPSMPLIPAYVADTSGTLSGSADACNEDPTIAEIGLDFSVMAPLPHDRQRLGAVGHGYTDLLGIAPGAAYRLVVPGSLGDPGNSDVVGALLGAALQSPAPNVITASLGFGLDAEGFPSRYEEDDALARSVIATIVHGAGIVVCLAADDGTRLFTNAAIGTDGGAAATLRARTPAEQTTLDDVATTTVPSVDLDSGAIDVGGVTLDDIFAANPLGAPPVLAMQHGFAETRWTGDTSYASGFGTRVDLSAPGDNIVAMQHDTEVRHHHAIDVVSVIASGTSASAPQVAAAAAVALQVARRTGRPFARAAGVRAFLAAHAAPIPPVPQADGPPRVGPQLDLTRVVEALLARGGTPEAPGVARTAVAFRQGGPYNTGIPPQLDTTFTENVDRDAIDLEDPSDPETGKPSNEGAESYLTVAPDWEGLPSGARFELVAGGKVLSRERATRLRAAAFLVAAGGKVPSTTSQTVRFDYRALLGGHVLARAPLALTFGPVGATSSLALAPVAPPVATDAPNASIPVRYDLTSYQDRLDDAALVVSRPGRTNPVTGPLYVPVYEARLPAKSGTIAVPVAELYGAGIYGVGIRLSRHYGLFSDIAYVRVSPSHDVRPPAPLFAASPGATPGHTLEIPPGTTFRLTYDVSGVPGATGARVEFAAPGPNEYGSRFTVDNPNGTLPDHDGLDTGARAELDLAGTSGTVVLDAARAKLVAADTQNVRVFPMAGATAVGEASDVSTLQLDGVVPHDGAPITGYGIQTGADTGLLTTQVVDANGETTLSDVETFDEQTLAPRGLVAQSTSANFGSFGNSIYGDDLAVLTEDVPTGNGSYRVVYPRVRDVPHGMLGEAWQPPARPTASADFLAESAVHHDTTGAFLYWDALGGNDAYWAFSADVAGRTASPLVGFQNTPLHGFTITTFDGFDATGDVSHAYGAFRDLAADCSTTPETIVVADFLTATATSFNASGESSGVGFAADGGTGLAALATNCVGPELHVIDVRRKASVATVRLSGTFVADVAVDQRNHRFLVEQSDVHGFDNNASWRIGVYDETGKFLSQTPPIFDFFGVIAVNDQPFQANGSLHEGFVAGDNVGGTEAFTYEQLQPFSYGP